jgi:small nuclear ribonucleoprotein (snRNP)-like protein
MAMSSSVFSVAPYHPSISVLHLKTLLQKVLRITVTDGRIFIGSFVGTDQPLNILLINVEEFRVGPDESPYGRYVGQVMIPWKMVAKAEVQNYHLRDTSKNNREVTL